MLKKKSGLIILLLVSIMAIVTVFNLEGEDLIKAKFYVEIDGDAVDFTDELGYPYLIRDTERTLIPLRIVAEKMGYEVGWNQEAKVAAVKDEDTNIAMKIGENMATVNGKKVPIDVQDGKVVDTKAMFLQAKGSHRTYVPLRFVSETMGAEVKYERKNKINYIYINTGKEKEDGEIVTTKQADAIVATMDNSWDEIDKLADKYKFSRLNLVDGHYFNYKKNQKDGFIEPVVIISNDGGKEYPNWFGFSIMNEEEYKDKGYQIKLKCTSNPEYGDKEWRSIEYFVRSLPKSYGAKVGDTVKYNMYIKNKDTGKIKIYPFTVTIGGAGTDEFGYLHTVN
jgi:hypothetical protein